MLTPISLHISSGSWNWRRPTRAKLTISWVTDLRVVVEVRGEVLESDLPVEGLPVLVYEGLGVREAEKKESERWENHGESDERKAGRELFIWEDEEIRKHQSILCQASVDIKAHTPYSCVWIELQFKRGFGNLFRCSASGENVTFCLSSFQPSYQPKCKYKVWWRFILFIIKYSC